MTFSKESPLLWSVFLDSLKTTPTRERAEKDFHDFLAFDDVSHILMLKSISERASRVRKNLEAVNGPLDEKTKQILAENVALLQMKFVEKELKEFMTEEASSHCPMSDNSKILLDRQLAQAHVKLSPETKKLVAQNVALLHVMEAEEAFKDILTDNGFMGASSVENSEVLFHRAFKQAGATLTDEHQKLYDENLALLKVMAAEYEINDALKSTVPHAPSSVAYIHEKARKSCKDAGVTLSEKTDKALTLNVALMNSMAALHEFKGFMKSTVPHDTASMVYINEKVRKSCKDAGITLSEKTDKALTQNVALMNSMAALHEFNDFMKSTTPYGSSLTVSIGKRIKSKLVAAGFTLTKKTEKALADNVKRVAALPDSYARSRTKTAPQNG